MSSNSTPQDYTANAPNSTRNYNGSGRHSNQRRHDNNNNNNTSRTGRNAKFPTVDDHEPEELRNMRTNHGEHLGTLRELFPDWKEEDLLFVMQEADGDLELAAARISDGHATQWSESKPRKKKSESTVSAGNSSVGGQQQQQYGKPSQRGGSGSGRGGRRDFQSDRGDRQNRGQGRSSGYSRNEPSGAEATGSWGDSWGDSNTGSYNDTNATAQPFDAVTSGGWGDDQPETVASVVGTTSGWGGSSQTQSNGWDSPAPAAKAPTAKAPATKPSQPQQSSWGSPSKTESAAPSWNAPQTQASDNGGWGSSSAATPKAAPAPKPSQPQQSSWGSPSKTAESAAPSWNAPQTEKSDNGGWGSSSAATPKSSNVAPAAKPSQPQQSSWGSPSKTESAAPSWNAPQTQASDNGGWGSSSAATQKSFSSAQQPSKPASTVSKPKGTWAQIVKPAEPPKAPEPKPVAKAPVQQPQRQPSPERRAASPERRAISPERSQERSASPQRSLSPVRPASPTKDVPAASPTSPVKSRSVSPSRDRSPGRPVHSSLVAPASTAPVAIGSPSSADKSSAKNKLSNQRRALKQDAAVVMPGSGVGVSPASGIPSATAPSVGVMFGSLSLGSSEPQQSRQQQAQAPMTSSGSATSPSDSNVQQPMSPNKTQQIDSNAQAAASAQSYHQQAAGSSQQSAYSSSLKGPQDPYLQQSQTQAPLPQTYGTQQVGHIGTPESLAGPYSSYLAAQQQQHLPSHSHAQPHTQPAGLGGFGVGPMAGLPTDVYGTLYGTDAQRAAAMGYYDPSVYGQTPAAAVTPTYSQGRDVKYNIPESAPTSQGGALAATTTPAQPQAQQAYGLPAANPYYPYYYLPNQFPNAYQQSGYAQPYGSKSMYPMYGAHQQHPAQHQQQGTGKPAPGSPYGAYPTSGSNTNAGQMYGQQSYDEMTSYAQNPAAAHPQQHQVGDFSKGYGSQLPQLPNFLSGQQQSQTGSTTMSSTGNHIPKPGDGSVTANSTKASSYGKYNDQSKVGSASSSSSGQQQSQHAQGQHQPQQGQHHPQAQQQQQGSYYPQQYGGYYGQSGYGHPFPQQHHSGHQQGSLQNRGSQQYWGSQS